MQHDHEDSDKSNLAPWATGWGFGEGLAVKALLFFIVVIMMITFLINTGGVQ